MESKSIVLSSREAQFKTSFYPPITLDPNSYHSLALITLDMYNSIPNIDDNNNVFRYEFENEMHDIIIPTGSYDIDAIDNYIQQTLDERQHVDLFEIKANLNTLKCNIDIKTPAIKIYFDHDNSLKDLFGFTKNTLEGVGTHVSTNLVDILKVNSILVDCNVISGSYLNDSQKAILYSFSPNVPPGYKIVEKPNSIIHLPVTLPVLTELKINLTDQNRNKINTRGEEITIRLELRSMKK